MDLLVLRRNLKEQFRSEGIDPTDADYILGEILGVSKTELVLTRDISNKVAKKINQIAKVRLKGVPVEKIFKKAYFYGLRFKVSDAVLSPRQDSEILVDEAIAVISQNGYKTMLDLCTGSGCLAVSVKKNCRVEVTASDISKKAVKVAKQNARLNGAEIKLICSNMFEKITGKFDVIISNPPYIETGEIASLQREVREHDPHLALDGGTDGLDFYRIIANNLTKHLNAGGMLILEIGETQKEQVKEIFKAFEFIKCVKDYGELDRVMIFRMKNEK